MTARKKVVVALPATAAIGDIKTQHAEVELESLAPLADIYEIKTDNEDEYIEIARDADAVITRWGRKLTRKIIMELEKCTVIGVSSVGVDQVDVEAATEAGIVVTNVPDIFIEEVADHTMMLLLASARRVKEIGEQVVQGNWLEARFPLTQQPRLWGQTLGLVGFGNVARAVARRAMPFGFRVIAYDPYVTELKMTGEDVEPVSFNELLERSDFLSLHTALNDETHHMLSVNEFEHMKDSVILINTGRGPVVDEAALIEALQEKKIAAAGLDVLETEPPQPDNPLLHMPNVILTPHCAPTNSRSWPETRRRVGREVALVLQGKWPRSCVNPTVLPKVNLERWQPYPMDRGPNR
jgi:D-3-phosphoglycerate dehydrogenase